MSVAVYVRASEGSLSEYEQRLHLNRWLSDRKMASVQWYVDKNGMSEFGQLNQDIQSGAIKTVVVWNLDRIANSTSEVIATVAKWGGFGVRIVGVSQEIDLTGKAAQHIASMFLSACRSKDESFRKRHLQGVSEAKQRGAYKGRKRGAVKAGVDPGRAVELRKKGLTLREVAKEMGVSLSSVSRYQREYEVY